MCCTCSSGQGRTAVADCLEVKFINQINQIKIKSHAMAQMELPLPELVIKDFTWDWTCFEFIATAKEWTAAKQLTVIPTLLRGKLIDYYVDLDDASKADLKLLKAALQESAGKKRNSYSCFKRF